MNIHSHIYSMISKFIHPHLLGFSITVALIIWATLILMTGENILTPFVILVCGVVGSTAMLFCAGLIGYRETFSTGVTLGVLIWVLGITWCSGLQEITFIVLGCTTILISACTGPVRWVLE